MESVSTLIEAGKKPEEIIQEITKGKHKIVEELDLKYVCDCTKSRFENGIGSLDIEELDSMISDGKPIEVTCQFCKKHYNFTIEELKTIRNKKDS